MIWVWIWVGYVCSLWFIFRISVNLMCVSWPLSSFHSSFLMESTSASDPTLPLLLNHDFDNKNGGRSHTRLTRRNSVNSLRASFLSTLPDKIRSGLDSESPYEDINLSSTALSKGLSIVICVCIKRDMYVYIN